MNAQALLERLLYVTLLLVFIAVGVGIYVAFNMETKIDTELQNQTKELQAIKKIDQDLQSGIDQLKDSNNQQTAYTQCLLSAQKVTKFSSFPVCSSPVSSLQAQSPPATSTSSPAQATTPAPKTTPATSPAPAVLNQPSLIQNAVNAVKSFLGGL